MTSNRVAESPWQFYLGAAIIVAIGACIAMLVLVERSIAPQLQRTEAEISSLPPSWAAGPAQKLVDYRDSLVRIRATFWILYLAASVVLAAGFVRLSRRMSRARLRHHYGQPKDSFEVVCRLSDRERPPFQYGIVSLLAAMLAVALVCAAVVYPVTPK